MPKPSHSKVVPSKRGRGSSHANKGGRRQNKRLEGLLNDRRPDSAVDDPQSHELDEEGGFDENGWCTRSQAVA
jgi:hypothetical protein